MSDPFLGQIQAFGFNFAPRGWALCNGQLLPIAQNSALFSLLGTTYGGDGRTTFGLPEMRGRVACHVGSGPGIASLSLGQKSGTNTNLLSVSNLPSHTHTLRANSAAGDSGSPGGNVPATAEDANRNELSIYSTSAPNASMDTAALQATGGGSAVNNMQPYLTINFCIAVQGIYPSRS